MSVLEGADARLYYETQGSGPLLIIIPGATGDARVFTTVGEHLAEYYTVVTYDRRGFSRSSLDGPQDYAHRLETDADDVARLIKHHGSGAATVFGTSSGAVIALSVLVRHPSAVAALAAYEPASVALLPDGPSWMEFLDHLYELYRDEGVVPALQTFREHVLTPGDREFLASTADPGTEHRHANATYWFEHELRQYPVAELGLGTLRRYTDRIVLLGGEQSRSYPAYQANVELAAGWADVLPRPPGGTSLRAATPPS